jgi:hypothetical protein
MNDTISKPQIEPLSNENWYKWKVQMKRYLEAKDLWQLIQNGDTVAVGEMVDAVDENDTVAVKTTDNQECNCDVNIVEYR